MNIMELRGSSQIGKKKGAHKIMGIAENFCDILAMYPDAKPIKEGGQKAVFLINHPDFGKCVLKVGIYSRPQTLERIQREVRTLWEIDSSYYPKNYDFQILDGNRFFILEQYVECVPLSSCLRNYTDPSDTLLLLRELVIGLEILWNKKIVHRDLKPDNILISSKGNPIIIDLGIARLLAEESLTQTIALRGPATPAYAAPEQLLNRKTNIDIRTDQFNLGIITMQLLMGGTHPFDPVVVGAGENIMENILQGRWNKGILENQDLKALRPLIERLLGKEPYMRFRSSESLLEQIDICLQR